MKKVICAAAAVLMVASLTACSGQSGESAAAGEGNTQQADGYPNKTIQVIVPFNAGSTTDTQCRFILPYLEKELGVSMAVVNNGGASGVIGTTDFLSREADGYNVLFSLPTPTLYKPAAGETEYTVEDLQPVSEVFSAPMYLIVKNDSPYENAEQLIDYETEEPWTAHTTNPVPFILVNADPKYTLRENGCLADIIPTLIQLMGMEQPAEMTGESLLVEK